MAPPVTKKKKISSDNRRLISSTALGGHEQQQQLMGSLMTSLGKRRSVRVARKMKQILRKIWICADVWLDILPFFDRPQLGLKLALISPRFDVLVNAHFGGKRELTLRKWMGLRKNSDTAAPELFGFTKIGKSQQPFTFALPEHPLPKNIRFSNLWICHMDHSVLAFLRANQQMWDRSGTKFFLYMSAFNINNIQSKWDWFVREIWPIFAQNIRWLYITGPNLDNLRRHTSSTILTDLNQLNSISSCHCYPDLVADDGPNASGGQALSKWLHTPRKDGQPKRLRCHAHKSGTIGWVNKFREAFICATTSVNFIIDFELRSKSMPIEQFELVNERTNEKLTMEKSRAFSTGRPWVMKRCQIGTTVQWEDENSDNLNDVCLAFEWQQKMDWCSFNSILAFILAITVPPAADQSKGKGRRIVRK